MEEDPFTDELNEFCDKLFEPEVPFNCVWAEIGVESSIEVKSLEASVDLQGDSSNSASLQLLSSIASSTLSLHLLRGSHVILFSFLSRRLALANHVLTC